MVIHQLLPSKFLFLQYYFYRTQLHILKNVVPNRDSRLSKIDPQMVIGFISVKTDSSMLRYAHW